MDHKFGQILVQSIKAANDRLSHLKVDAVNKAVMVRLSTMPQMKRMNPEETDIGRTLTKHFIKRWAADIEVQHVMQQLGFLEEELKLWMRHNVMYKGRLLRVIGVAPQKVRFKRRPRPVQRRNIIERAIIRICPSCCGSP